ncbi:MAG: DUF1697 domain-containing protein [Christensenellales bacterium]|jgi:uncharacterized protein (DUF1697 family)
MTTTWIILLRGVIPTGKNKVQMAALREALLQAGFARVRTWIQSGNALVDTALTREQTGERVARVLREDLGVDLGVILKTAEEITAVLDGNPFAGLDATRVFYGLFNEAPAADKTTELEDMDFGEDQLRITDQAVYTYIPGSAARTKLNNTYLQRKLGITLTFRNANTLSKLVEMAGEA